MMNLNILKFVLSAVSSKDCGLFFFVFGLVLVFGCLVFGCFEELLQLHDFIDPPILNPNVLLRLLAGKEFPERH